MTTKPKRGGARAGAGRKAKDGVETKRYNLSLDDFTVTEARKLALELTGDSDISIGIRSAFRKLTDSQ